MKERRDMFIQRHTKRTVKANEDIMDPNVVEDEVVDGEGEGEAEVIVDPEATDLLFEAEDVAELIAEVTGETVEVTVEDDSVEFAIGEDVYTVEAEGDEEVLEAATKKVLRGKRTIAANTKRRPAKAPARRQVAASTKTVRRVPTRRK